MDENLKEIFAYPIFLKKAFTLYVHTEEIDLYTSKSLKEKFFIALKKSGIISKPVLDTIYTMIQNETLVPCFYNSGLLKLIKFRLYFHGERKGRLAFYSPKYKKVIIIMSDNYFDKYDGNSNGIKRIFQTAKIILKSGYYSDKWLGIITIHELMHKASNISNKKFMYLSEKRLLKYYSIFFTSLYKVKDQNKDFMILVKDYLSFINHFELETSVLTHSQLDLFIIKYSNLLKRMEKFSSLNTKESNDKSELLIETIITYFNNPQEYINNVTSKFIDVARALYDGYKYTLSGEIPTSIYIQELFAPSEVIALSSETGQLSNIDQILKGIK